MPEILDQQSPEAAERKEIREDKTLVYLYRLVAFVVCLLLVLILTPGADLSDEMSDLIVTVS